MSDRIRCVIALLAICSSAMRAEEHILLLPENFAVLGATGPTETTRLDPDPAAPGFIYLPGEAVALRVLAEGGGRGVIEVQEFGTRDPSALCDDPAGFSLGGKAAKIAPIGAPVRVEADLGDGAVPATVTIPPSPRLGAFMVVLERGGARTVLGTYARVPTPNPTATIEDTPVFGEGQFFDERFLTTHAAIYQRMGIKGARCELGWNEAADGSVDWQRYDTFFAALEAHGLQAMTTLAAHPPWTRPFGEPTPAAGYIDTPYSGHGDWLCKPELYPRYRAWIEAFCRRYWKDGKGGLWALEHFNEPWEGGGISGWARDCRQYRELMRVIAYAARVVDPRIKLAAASSIMNTEDKFYSDGSRVFDQWIDLFTDHYVPPMNCYGPMVAAAHGKESMETESWLVNAEYKLPQAMAQFMAAGQLRLCPWHPNMMYDRLPGVPDGASAPSPVVTASAAFNAFVSGKRFTRMVFHQHLPWLFQFGADEDPESLLIMFGQLWSVGGDSPRDRLWWQVDGVDGGTMTIQNADGLLQLFDTAGNPLPATATVELGMNVIPTYIRCAKGAKAAAERIAQARIVGKRPVEIVPHDVAGRLAPRATFVVRVVNRLPSRISGELVATPPAGLTLTSDRTPFALAGGESIDLTFAVAAVALSPINAYPFTFTARTDAGDAEWKETLGAAIVVRGAKAIDGDLGDWADVPGVMLVKGATPDQTEKMRRPWLELASELPEGAFAEVKFAWDDANLYLCARVNDPTPETDASRWATRDEDSYFHTGALDNAPNYKEFLAQHGPGRSLAEAPYVYARAPEAGCTYRRDRLQFAFDTSPGWHDLAATTDRVPEGFHAIPDSDYEFSLYACDDGAAELWQLLGPGIPRMHDYPRQPRSQTTTGAVDTARHVVRREGTVLIYECAIPAHEIGELKMTAGTTFGLALRAGDSAGLGLDYGGDKACTKHNGLSLHPYWERKHSAAPRWTLVE